MVEINGVPLEPLKPLAVRGWFWDGGELDPGLRLPAFSRAFTRREAPRYPSGLASCDEQTLKRWEADLYRYPTFAYREAYLWKNHKEGMTRVADATEREFFMNKPKGITSMLFKKSEIKFGVEDFDTVRCAAIGTSHHVGSLGALLYLGLGKGRFSGWGSAALFGEVGNPRVNRRPRFPLEPR